MLFLLMAIPVLFFMFALLGRLFLYTIAGLVYLFGLLWRLFLQLKARRKARILATLANIKPAPVQHIRFFGRKSALVAAVLSFAFLVVVVENSHGFHDVASVFALLIVWGLFWIFLWCTIAGLVYLFGLLWRLFLQLKARRKARIPATLANIKPAPVQPIRFFGRKSALVAAVLSSAFFVAVVENSHGFHDVVSLVALLIVWGLFWIFLWCAIGGLVYLFGTLWRLFLQLKARRIAS